MLRMLRMVSTKTQNSYSVTRRKNAQNAQKEYSEYLQCYAEEECSGYSDCSERILRILTVFREERMLRILIVSRGVIWVPIIQGAAHFPSSTWAN